MAVYRVRVSFPDEDMWTFVTHECGFNQGKVIEYTDLKKAQEVANQYEGGIVLQVKENDDTTRNK